MKVPLKDTLGNYLELSLRNYLTQDEEENDDYFFKIATVYELHRIADVIEDIHVCTDHSVSVTGSVNTYEQNL